MRDYKIDFDVKDVDNTVKEFVDVVMQIDGVLAVYVFGSYVKKRMHGMSDVDMCVIGNVSVKDKMEILLGKFPEILDISFFGDLSIWMKFRIFREGLCLAVADNMKLNIVKMATLGEYLDFKPVIDDIVEKELALNV